MNNYLNGTGVALVTPFDEAGKVDHAALERLVAHVLSTQVKYLVVMGTTAESVTLSAKEKEEAINTIQQTNQGKLPLVLGLGGNNTQEVKKAFQTKKLDAFHALLSVAPAYNKPSQEGMYQHFKTLAEATDKDIILYNVPSRTASNLAPETTLRLARTFENIIAIKEASPDYTQSTSLLKEAPKGFRVLSGDDEYALPMTLAGGSGVISVLGQALPSYAQMIEFALEHKVTEAYALQYAFLDLLRAIYDEGNPSGIKALLSVMGICQPYTRLPLVRASDSLQQKIKQVYDLVQKS